MRKLISIYSVILLCLAPMCLIGQLEIGFDSRTANAGETIEIDVIAENFDELISVQFSINWDPAIFSFVSVIDPTDILPEFTINGNLGLPTTADAVDDGELTFSWSRQSTQEATIPDGTKMFTILLDAIGDECESTSLTITDSPSQIEAVDVDKNFVSITAVGGDLDIAGDNCGGGPPMGGSCAGSPDVSMIIEDLTVEMNENVCIPVIARNFTDIASIQAAITWNPNRLSFTGLNPGAIMNDVSSDANANQGELRYLWFDNTATNPITVADGTTLFELCFDVQGRAGQTGNIDIGSLPTYVLEVTNSNGVVETCTQGATITIGEDEVEPENCRTTDNVAFIIEDTDAEEGTNTCIAVTARNFTDVAAFSTGIRWDADVLEFDRIVGVEITGETPNLLDAPNGTINYLWQDPTGVNPADVPDGATLFELCFDVIGDVDESTLLELASFPIFPVEVANSQGVAVNNCIEGGVITVVEGEVEPENCNTTDDVAFIVPSVTGESGSTVCVPITARNFTNVAAFMAGIQWDPSVLEFVNIMGVEITGETPNLSDAPNGTINYLWQDQTGVNPVTVRDGNTLFELCFIVRGDVGEATTVELVEFPIFPIEVASAEGVGLAYCSQGGSFTVTMSQSTCNDGVQNGDEEDVDCGGSCEPCIDTNCNTTSDPAFIILGQSAPSGASSVCIPVTARNFSDGTSFSTDITWDSSVLQYGGVNGVELADATLELENAGNGSLGYSWTGLATTVADGGTLFEICFNIVGDEGASSDIDFDNLSFVGPAGEADITCTLLGTINATAEEIDLNCGTTDDPAFFITGQSANSGTQSVCIPITARNFTAITEFTTRLSWDPAVLAFNSINDGTLTNARVNSNNTSNGRLGYSWTGSAFTVTDGGTLFEICFDIIGAEGETSTIEFDNIMLTSSEGPIRRVCDDNVLNSNNLITVTAEEVDLNCNTTPDPAFFIEGRSASSQSTSICVPISARNFNGGTSFSTDITWDPAILEYSSITTAALPGTIENVSPGSVSFSWNGSAATFSDGQTLFEICFNVIGSEGTSSEVSFDNLSYSDAGGQASRTCAVPGTITATAEEVDLNCGTTTDPAFFVSGQSARSGAISVCIPVTARNFVGVSEFATGLTWDSSILRYNGINDRDLTAGMVDADNANNGSISYSWTGNPFTVADGGTLFEICFDVIGSNGASSSIEFQNIMLTNRQGPVSRICDDNILNNNNIISVTAPDTNCNSTSDPAFIISAGSAPSGSTSVCIPVTARNFNGISDFSTDMTYDASVLSFAGINDGSLGGATVDDDNSGNGSINFSWNGSSTTLAEGSTLFEICFDVIGEEGTRSDLNFMNLMLTGMNGSFPVTCTSSSTFTTTMSEQPFVNITAGSVSVNSGQEVCLPISAANFREIQSAQFNLQWDSEILSFSRINVGDLPDFGSSSANFVGPDKLRVSWNPFVAVSLPDNSVLFQVCFNALPCSPAGSTQTSNVDFVDDSNIVIEVSNADGEVVEVRANVGSVTVNCSEPMCNPEDLVNISSINGPTCFGDTNGSFDATYIGTGTFTCTWRDSGGNVIETSSENCSLSGLAAGTYRGVINTSGGCNVAIPDVVIPQIDRLAITNSNNQSGSCDQGGFIDLTVEGGTMPYTYTWNPDLGNISDPQNLAMGTYAVTITDVNGCSTNSSFAIGGPADTTAPSLVSEVVTNRSCDTPTQSINLDVEGGCPPVTYSWEGPNGQTRNTQDISNVDFGTWNLTISDMGGRMITRSYSLVDEIAPINIGLDQLSDAACEGENTGSIQVTVTGGCGASPDDYNFLWNNTWTLEDLNQIAAGEYTLVVTDRRNPAVSAERTFNVMNGGAAFGLNGTVNNADNDDGDNGTIDLIIEGGSGSYSFEWSDGDTGQNRTGLTAGTYSVTVTDNTSGCARGVSFNVAADAPLRVDILPSNEILTSCIGLADAIIDGSIFGGCGGATITVNGVLATFPIIELGPGTYTIESMDECGGTFSTEVTVSDPMPIEIMVDTIGCVTTADGFIDIDISGGTGIFEITWSGGTESEDGLSVTDLNAGSVTVIVEDENGCQAANQDIEVRDCSDMTVTDDCDEYRDIITPNGDGIHDNLMIPCTSNIDNQPNILSIYDRWGRLVYTANNYDNQWMGTDNAGNLLDEGGYMWVLEIQTEGSRRIEKGTITVLRSRY